MEIDYKNLVKEGKSEIKCSKEESYKLKIKTHYAQNKRETDRIETNQLKKKSSIVREDCSRTKRKKP